MQAFRVIEERPPGKGRLKAEYPGSFETTEPEIVAWHLWAADSAEKNDQWFAAVFHLRCLSAIRPADPTLARRLEKARKAFAEQPTKEPRR